MGGNSGKKVRAGGGSGKKASVKQKPQLVKMDIWVYAFTANDIENLGMSDEPGLTTCFHGPNITDDEKKIALNKVLGDLTNVLQIYHMTIPKKGAAKDDKQIIIFNMVANTNTKNLDIYKIGTPTSSLPDDTASKEILKKLEKYNVKTRGFTPDENKAVLMSLNIFSDDELNKAKDIVLVRDSVAPSDVKTGGKYMPELHEAHIYNEGFKNGLLFVYGTQTAAILPRVAHVVLHEVAHAIADSRIRIPYQRAQQAERNYDNARSRMSLNWRNYYKEWTEGDITKYRYDPEQNVPAAQRVNYRADVSTLNAAASALKTAKNEYLRAGKGGMITKFRDIIKPLTPVTQYSKEERENAQMAGKSLEEADGEFFADAYSLYRMYPNWLEENRQKVYKFFSNGEHLK